MPLLEEPVQEIMQNKSEEKASKTESNTRRPTFVKITCRAIPIRPYKNPWQTDRATLLYLESTAGSLHGMASLPQLPNFACLDVS